MLPPSASTHSSAGDGYAAIFGSRGFPYDRAMRAFPEARRREFELLFRSRPLRDDERLVDVPSLGGYLRWYFPQLGPVINLDFAPSLQPGVRTVRPEGTWDLPTDLSRIICLAALHHVEDLTGFLANLSRQIRPGVLVHLADVGQGSRIARFLDGFVGAHTPTGHRGHYRDWSRQAFPAGLIRRDVSTLPCPWTLPDAGSAARFTRLLFGLEGVGDDALLAALQSMVGLEGHPDGRVTILWELTYVDLERVDPERVDPERLPAE